MPTFGYAQLLLAAVSGTARGFGTSLGAVNHTSHAFGTDIKSSAGVLLQFPLNENELRTQGWFRYSAACDPLLGWAWSVDQEGVRQYKPVTLYTTAGGQISGIGMRFYGEVKQKLIDAGFFRDGNQLDVAFRDSPCDDTTPAPAQGLGEAGLGDRLIVAPHGAKHSLPLSDPKQFRGSCFDGMGWHYFEDLTWTEETYGTAMTWYAENIVPVIAMYDDRHLNINAIFFASATRQQTLMPPTKNMWDEVPLYTYLMCKNFCSADCAFKDSWGMSTDHIFFNNPHTGPAATCPPELECFMKGTGCCPKATSDVLV